MLTCVFFFFIVVFKIQVKQFCCFWKDWWDTVGSAEHAQELQSTNKCFFLVLSSFMRRLWLMKQTWLLRSLSKRETGKLCCRLHKQQGLAAWFLAQLSVTSDCVLAGMAVALTPCPSHISPSNWQRLNFSGGRWWEKRQQLMLVVKITIIISLRV